MNGILFHWFIVGTLVYLLWKYRGDILALAMVLLCYPSVFEYYGGTAQNAHKAVMLLFVFYVFARRQAWNRFRGEYTLWGVALALFTLQFFYATMVYSNNSWTIIFSQYARYAEAFMLFFLFEQEIFKNGKKDFYIKVCYDIILMNIFISIFKWFLYRTLIEGLVGSFCIVGGGLGTVVPLAGLFILWYYRKGDFKTVDWFYVVGLLWIGITSGKRAVVFILPVLLLALMSYVKGVNINKYMIVGIAFVPVVLYLGVRLVPSLNPDNAVWGKFDIDYAIDYANRYQFGEEGAEGQMETLRAGDNQVSYSGGGYAVGNKIKTEGRGGSFVGLLKFILSDRKMTTNDMWGVGFKNMYGIDYATFMHLDMTVMLNHKGSASGMYQTYIALGVMGILPYVIFCFLPFFYCKHFRLKTVMIGLLAWEYFLYSGLFFRYSSLVMMLYLVMLSVNYDWAVAHRIKVK